LLPENINEQLHDN